jgi:hypothetical protein
VIDLKNEMIIFYSTTFLNGDHKQAKNIIERSNRVTARKIDIFYISLLGGIIINLFYAITFEIWLSEKPSHDKM